MSIKLKFDSPGWSSQATLKDDALAELLTLINKYKDEASVAVAPSGNVQDVSPAGDRSATVKEWLSAHSATEALNHLNWQTYPDKILLLGAFHEANGGKEGWRCANIVSRFSEAREPAPANFPRDISNAIRDSLITPVTPRSYKVARVGWNKIADAIAALQPS